MLLYKQKKNQSVGKDNRFLISTNVLGSVGLIRFIVNKDELAATVIDTTLKSYACEGRLPILGSNLNNFLYCSNAESDALNLWETIGSNGSRNVMLCKKPQLQKDYRSGCRKESRNAPEEKWELEGLDQ